MHTKLLSVRKHFASCMLCMVAVQIGLNKLHDTIDTLVGFMLRSILMRKEPNNKPSAWDRSENEKKKRKKLLISIITLAKKHDVK